MVSRHKDVDHMLVSFNQKDNIVKIPPHWITESYLNYDIFRHLSIIGTNVNVVAISITCIFAYTG